MSGRSAPTARASRELAGIMKAVNTTAITAGALYAMTGSAAVALIGTATSGALAAWCMWLHRPGYKHYAVGTLDDIGAKSGVDVESGAPSGVPGTN